MGWDRSAARVIQEEGVTLPGLARRGSWQGLTPFKTPAALRHGNGCLAYRCGEENHCACLLLPKRKSQSARCRPSIEKRLRNFIKRSGIYMLLKVTIWSMGPHVKLWCWRPLKEWVGGGLPEGRRPQRGVVSWPRAPLRE